MALEGVWTITSQITVPALTQTAVSTITWTRPTTEQSMLTTFSTLTTATEVTVSAYPVTEQVAETGLVEFVLLLENAFGQPYSTYTAAIPIVFEQNGSVSFEPEPGQNSGWDSWNSSQQGGLIAGVAIAFFLVLGMAWLMWLCCQRRRTNWIVPNFQPNPVVGPVLVGSPTTQLRNMLV